MSRKRGTYFGYLRHDESENVKIPRQTLYNRQKKVRKNELN